MNKDDRNILVNFLEQLTKCIREEKTSERDDKLLTEFFIRYIFETQGQEDQDDERKIKRYMALGWYIDKYHCSSSKEKENLFTK